MHWACAVAYAAVSKSREQILEWESRWLVPAGIATFAAIALLVAGTIVGGPVSGDGKAEILRSANEHGSSLMIGSALQAIGFALLILPLLVLFRAAQARSERVRGQLVGLIIVAPLFFAVATLLTGVATTDAADQFVAGNAKSTLTAKEAASDCRSDLDDVGAKEFGEEFGGAEGTNPEERCAETKVEDDEATNAIRDASVSGLAEGLSIGGRFGLAISLLYTCLWAMRVGLSDPLLGLAGHGARRRHPARPGPLRRPLVHLHRPAPGRQSPGRATSRLGGGRGDSVADAG